MKWLSERNIDVNKDKKTHIYAITATFSDGFDLIQC